MDNQTLRQNVRRWREQLSKDVVVHKSLTIMSHIQDYFLVNHHFEGFLCYYPTRGEVDLRPLYEQLLRRNAALYFPVTGKDGLEFYRVESLSDFSEGRFGIMEPRSMQALDDFTGVLSFTPGLCFSKSGERLGFGGGYYDRFYEAHPNITRVGVCYDEQLSDEITVMDWDIAMDYVACESGVFTNL